MDQLIEWWIISLNMTQAWYIRLPINNRRPNQNACCDTVPSENNIKHQETFVIKVSQPSYHPNIYM